MLKKAKIFHPTFIENGPHLRPQLEQVKHAFQEQETGHNHHKSL